jgi:hypothetical protein
MRWGGCSGDYLLACLHCLHCQRSFFFPKPFLFLFFCCSNELRSNDTPAAGRTFFLLLCMCIYVNNCVNSTQYNIIHQH